MENVQSFDRPLAYDLAKSIEYSKKTNSQNQVDGTNTLQLTGCPDSGDVIYDF
jgi:hypothetical protein